MTFFDDVLIRFFHLDNIGLYLAFALFGLGLLVIGRVSWRYWRIKTSLTHFISLIQESTDTTSFTDKYEHFRSQVITIPSAQRAWTEFEETLIPPLEDIDDPNYQVYRNTKRPSVYFSSSSIHHLQLKAWIQPHTFVGLGLLFTFLGLVAALTETGKAFGSANAESLKDALESLLVVAGTKFWASVGGLFTSILVGAALNFYSSSIRKQLHIICDMLEERLLYANHERIAVDQFSHAQRQTRRLEEMSTEITVALGNRISDALAELPPMFGESMKPVTDELSKVTRNLGADNQQAIEDMAEKFAQQLTNSSGDSFQQVNNQLEKLVGTLEVTATKLAGGGNDLRSGLEGSIANINQTMLDISRQLKESTSEAGGRFKDDAEAASSGLRSVILELQSQQEASINGMNQLTDTLGVMSTNVAKSVESLIAQSGREIGDSIDKTITGTSNKVKEALEGVGTDIENRVRKATEAAQDSFIGSFESLQQKLTDASEGLSLSISGWRSHLNDISSRFEAISGQLSNQVGAISDVNDKVKLTGNAFEQSAQAVRNASSPLLSASQQLDQGVNRVSTMLETAIDETRRTSESIDNNLKIMSASVGALQSAWESNGQHLKNVDTELENAFRQVTEHLSSSLGQLSHFATTLDSHLSDSLQHLSGFVMATHELVEELSETKRLN